MRKITVPATSKAFEKLLNEGGSAQQVAVGMLDALASAVQAFMEAVPQSDVSTELKWQIASVAQVIDNTRAVLRADQGLGIALLDASDLPGDLIAELRALAESMGKVAEGEDAEGENAAGKGDE